MNGETETETESEREREKDSRYIIHLKKTREDSSFSRKGESSVGLKDWAIYQLWTVLKCAVFALLYQ